MVLTHGAGLEVQNKPVMAWRVTPDPLGQQADGLREGKACGPLTRDVLAVSDGVSEAGGPHVAMESTGADWTPVDHLREGTCTVLLVHAAQGKNVPGRTTDRAAARWLATRRRQGLLQASVLPPAAPRDRRDLPRDRTTLVPERSRAGNRVPGVLARATITLASVASELLGVSGRAILAALIAGRAAPAAMAAWATGRLRSQRPVVAQARTGVVRAQPRRGVALPLAPLACLEEPLDALSADLARRLTALRATPPPPPPVAWVGAPAAGGSAAEPVPPAPPMTLARAVPGLDTMPGVQPRGGERWVAAGGIAMARCGTAARLAAWSGVAPGPDASAGQQRSGTTRQGHRALRTGRTPWAHAAAGTKDTSLSAGYHRRAARRGQNRALMAVAHAIVVSAF